MKKMMTLLVMVMTMAIAVSAQPAGSDSFVRFIHGSPDAPATTVWIDGQAVIYDLGFEEDSPYARIPRGEHRFQVTPAGLTEPAVIDAVVDMPARSDFTVVAVGPLVGIEPLIVPDMKVDVPYLSSAIRFIHGVYDAPAVDIAVKNGPVLFADAGFKDISDHIWVPTGTYDLEVRVAGTSQVVMEIPDVNLAREETYTVYALGSLDMLEVKQIEDEKFGNVIRTTI